MGYESRTHTDAAEMVDRVLERGRNAKERVVSDTAESIAYQRLKRVKWFREWLESEVPAMSTDANVEFTPDPTKADAHTTHGDIDSNISVATGTDTDSTDTNTDTDTNPDTNNTNPVDTHISDR